jgi:hypothetical protein
MATKHGMRPKYGKRHPLYSRWVSLKQRCNNPADKSYDSYGARGISVCLSWNLDYKTFYDWAIASGFQPNLQLDRIDTNGNYEPSNCRWVTSKENTNNRRCTVKVLINGITMTPEEASSLSGVGTSTIKTRLQRGWSDNEAVFTPSSKRKPRRSNV